MREYLTCGLVKRMVIRSKNEEDNKELILERIGQNVDLSLYNRIDDDEYIILNIKKDIFEKNIYELVCEQVSRFSLREYEKLLVEYELKELKNMDYEGLIKCAKRNPISTFRFKRGDGDNDISYLDPKGECVIYCDLIQFIQTGETFFECYNEMFTYFRNCIISSSNNPIRTAMILTLTP